jgi:hypothetical protein
VVGFPVVGIPVVGIPFPAVETRFLAEGTRFQVFPAPAA